MKRLFTALLMLLCLFFVSSEAQALEWPGVEGSLGALYRVPVYTSWGLQMSGELRSIPSHSRTYQSVSIGPGWYCGNKWYYVTVGGIRNYFAAGNEALTWGLQSGMSTSNGNIWCEADMHFVQSNGFKRQFIGNYTFVRRFAPLTLTANIEQRSTNRIRIGPGIGLATSDGVWIQAKWFIWRDIDVANYPPMHTVSIEARWYFPWPGEDAKRQAGYSRYLNMPPLPPK
jgi:hypothetical protein